MCLKRPPPLKHLWIGRAHAGRWCDGRARGIERDAIQRLYRRDKNADSLVIHKLLLKPVKKNHRRYFKIMHTKSRITCFAKPTCFFCMALWIFGVEKLEP